MADTAADTLAGALAKEASSEAAASDYDGAVSEEHEDFVLRLVHLRTADPDVMRVKAAAVLNMWGGEADRFDGAVERAAAAEDADPEDALCFSLMQDVLRSLSTERWVSA